MDTWMKIVFLVVVGALIGGLTNLVAIRMLFRPYKPWKIGKYQVPFTPGLIPKRRHDLAIKMGETVKNHLLTAEGIQSKVTDPVFIEEITSLVKTEARGFLESDITLQRFLEEQMNVSNAEAVIAEKATALVQDKLNAILNEVKEQTLSELLPLSMTAAVDGKIGAAAQFIIDKGIAFLESKDGKETVSKGIDAFLAERGMLLNMLSMFFGNVKLVDKIQPEMIKLLKQPQTKETIEKLIRQEWKSALQHKAGDLQDMLNAETWVEPGAARIVSQLPIGNLLHQPLEGVPEQYKEAVLERFIPRIVDLFMKSINDRLAMILDKLQIAKIVEEQVETFSLERLEQIIIDVAKKELTMITWLGALLGGIIALFQALVLTLL
ncbi:DUF445 domain-containing protein [Fictibacillus fluitans]|uniref:DUF445 family protein n=1 Tax=Fictibacillus fluitans TaxID=3058422 RepID=A0ABT8I1Q3_9BACL|nr:DUF445 family protein [Fictibacillus sp. NE201]MDN4526964.1 DUF445 family protein [Fictibacillus sp. NE201]